MTARIPMVRSWLSIDRSRLLHPDVKDYALVFRGCPMFTKWRRDAVRPEDAPNADFTEGYVAC